MSARLGDVARRAEPRDTTPPRQVIHRALRRFLPPSEAEQATRDIWAALVAADPLYTQAGAAFNLVRRLSITPYQVKDLRRCTFAARRILEEAEKESAS